jgi:hypothetical protein
MALKTCGKGHQFNKTSDCPSCPVCEVERRPTEGFLAKLGAPARRALENHGIQSLDQLATFSEKDILKLHGIGKSTIPKLKAALDQVGLTFKL